MIKIENNDQIQPKMADIDLFLNMLNGIFNSIRIFDMFDRSIFNIEYVVQRSSSNVNFYYEKQCISYNLRPLIRM